MRTEPIKAGERKEGSDVEAKNAHWLHA
jgi:hypothetical protein